MSRKKAGLSKKYVDVCRRLGWNVDIDSEEKTVELRQYSPAGEDFSFEVDIIGFVDEVSEYAEDFDEDEHVCNWIDAKLRGCTGVPTAKELVKDADDIKKMLLDLSAALEEVEAA